MKIRTVALVIFLLCVGCNASTNERDEPLWTPERAKAEVANHVYEEQFAKWVNLQEDDRTRHNGPERLVVTDWEANYLGAQTWKVTGEQLGEWLAFEDGESSVQSALPSTPTPIPQRILTLGRATIDGPSGDRSYGDSVMKDCETAGDGRHWGHGAQVEIVGSAVHCEPFPFYLVKDSDGQLWWVYDFYLKQ